jgi:hypothetical protein
MHIIFEIDLKLITKSKIENNPIYIHTLTYMYTT